MYTFGATGHQGQALKRDLPAASLALAKGLVGIQSAQGRLHGIQFHPGRVQGCLHHTFIVDGIHSADPAYRIFGTDRLRHVFHSGDLRKGALNL